jgi:hypothetical protein
MLGAAEVRAVVDAGAGGGELDDEGVVAVEVAAERDLRSR